ncbi:MAG: transposase [Bacteroidetes bacterium]|nr:transposase [Bacteroidota bacterium]
MTATFSQIFIQVVFSVKSRNNLIPQENLEEVFEYMAGIIRNKGHKPIIVGGVSSHVHAFIGFKPGGSISGLVRDIKNNTTNFINQQDWMTDKFSWQNGFGAFSYGKSQVDQVYNYISNQAEHHITKSFREEYVIFLEKFGVDYDEKYLPPEIE